MHLRIVPFVAVLLVAPACGQPTPGSLPVPDSHETVRTVDGRAIPVDELDRFLERQMERFDVPGLSIALIDDARVVYHRALGLANVRTGEKVTERTLFEAASLSKPLFAYFAMQQVEQGLLDLDKPLYAYLPYPDIASDERYKLITARMVLSHTSGLPNWRSDNADGKLDIAFTPGTDYRYSGEGYQYLKTVLVHLRDTDDVGLDALFQKEVAEPLGAEHLHFTWNAYQAEHKATGHRNGRPTDKAPQGDPDVFGAAYSLHTGAMDYARFLIAMMQKKGLHEETWAEMLRLHYRFPEDREGLGQSLGFVMDSTAHGLVYAHSGNNGDFKAYAQFYPDSASGVVIFTNFDRLFESGFADALGAFLGEGEGG